MTIPASTPPGLSRGGAAALKAAIIASRCTDEGVCIMCADCGHIFVASIPFSDESEQVMNTDLSRALWYHLCALPRVERKPVRGNGRKPKLRR